MPKKRTSSKSRSTCNRNQKRNPLTGRCILKNGPTARLLSQGRLSYTVKRSLAKWHRRLSNKHRTSAKGRKAPGVSATLFASGTVRRGLNRKDWKVKRASNGVKRWVPA